MSIQIRFCTILMVALGWGGFAAAAETPTTAPATQPVVGMIKPAKEGPWFIDSATGQRFTPFGINYTPHNVQAGRRGATRDNWIRFSAEVSDRDCALMADAGANVLRVFLTAKSFIPAEAGVVPEESLKKAESLVAIARKHGMRVIFGGPDWWEGSTPLFPIDGYDSTGLWGDKQLEALAAFWRVFAARFKDEPGVFAYSLRNEPMVPRTIPEPIWQDFLRRKYGTPDAVGKAWGRTITSWADCQRPDDVDKADDQALYDYQLAREFVAYRWARVQAEAIRSVDPNHMVTNGGIQWDVPLFRHFHPSPYGYDGFDPRNFAQLFDYLSIHWYDIRPDHLRNDAAYQPLGERYLEGFLAYCRVGNKPLLLEEFPNPVLQREGYSRSFYAHVSGALIWEYMSVSTPQGMRDWAVPLLRATRAKLESRVPVSLDGPDVIVWKIDKRRLLTWYGDPSTFRHNPAWKNSTGSEYWHDTGGYWIDHYGEIRQGHETRIRIDVTGEGPEFFDSMYRKPAQ